MARPTINPIRDTIAAGKTIINNTIREPAMAVGSGGITNTADAVMRKTITVSFGQQTGAFSRMLMVAGAEAPRITYVGFTGNVAMHHNVSAANTWIASVINARTGTSLNVNAASLSGVTLAATAFKSIPVNNGAATLLSGEGLRANFTVSGSPQTLTDATVVVRYIPTTNA